MQGQQTGHTSLFGLAVVAAPKIIGCGTAVVVGMMEVVSMSAFWRSVAPGAQL
jgi:hypothetical protein